MALDKTDLPDGDGGGAIDPNGWLRVLLLLLGLGLLAGASPAPKTPGVCYDPTGRGLTISRYILDDLNSAPRSAPLNTAADPWAVQGGEFLDFNNPAVVQAYESRYGPFTACVGARSSTPACAGHSMKRFIGPGNEVRSLMGDALEWWGTFAPGNLGGPVGCVGTGFPTEREITDLQATGDAQIWETWHRQVLPGGSVDRPVVECDKSKPPGDYVVRDSFWGWMEFRLNQCGTPPAPPGPTIPPAPAPTPAPVPPPKPAPPPAAAPLPFCDDLKGAGGLVAWWYRSGTESTARLETQACRLRPQR